MKVNLSSDVTQRRMFKSQSCKMFPLKNDFVQIIKTENYTIFLKSCKNSILISCSVLQSSIKPYITIPGTDFTHYLYIQICAQNILCEHRSPVFTGGLLLTTLKIQNAFNSSQSWPQEVRSPGYSSGPIAMHLFTQPFNKNLLKMCDSQALVSIFGLN